MSTWVRQTLTFVSSIGGQRYDPIRGQGENLDRAARWHSFKKDDISARMRITAPGIRIDTQLIKNR